MPQISVIVPIYNVENYLRRCIDSILGQTFTDFELILVDDGSPDHCPDICDEYAAKDSRVKVIHKPNGGVSSARNAGLDIAQAEYITFCDSDDYYLPDWLETLATELQAEKSDLLMGNYLEVDSLGNELSKSRKQPGTWQPDSRRERYSYIINQVLYGGNGWTIWCSAFAKKVIDKHKIRFCETCGNYAEDLGFMLDFVLHCSGIRCIEHVGYCYVQHEGSMMSSSQKTAKLNELNEVSHFFGSHYLEQYPSRRRKIDYAVIHYLIMYTEYKRLMYGFTGGGFSDLPQECLKIRHQQWYKQNQRRLVLALGRLKRSIMPKKDTDLLMIARYSIHQIPQLFAAESAVYYKFIRKNK